MENATTGVPLTQEEKLLEQLVNNNNNVQNTSSSSSSLILRSSPPNMRWGVTAVKPTDYNHEIMSKYERTGMKIVRRKKNKAALRSKVKGSVENKFIKDIRTNVGVCRGFCQNCDTFIGFVFSNEQKSPTKQRFVCNPSSLVFRD